MTTNGRRAAHGMTVALFLFAASIIFVFTTFVWPIDVLTKLDLQVSGAPRAGQDLTVIVDYCKPVDIAPTTVRWALTDGLTILLPESNAILPPGCHVRTFVIPTTPHMTAGHYVLEITAEYHPLPWRTEIERASSPVFTVGP